jgi:hypothetical protein
MSNLFVETDDITRAVEQIANPLEHLVGDGKKFLTNEELAKGKLYSDLYVPKLENEINVLKQARAQLEAELEASKSRAQETLTMVNQSEANTQGSNENTNVTNNLTQEQLDAYFESKYSATKEAEKRQANVESVRTVLERNLGDKYTEHMKTMADEYGQEYLSKMAEENPKAFLKLAGVGETRPQMTSKPSTNLFTPPTNAINVNAQISTPKNGAKHWAKVRKENPKFYNSIDGYNQRLADITQLGDDYFNN